MMRMTRLAALASAALAAGTGAALRSSSTISSRLSGPHDVVVALVAVRSAEAAAPLRTVPTTVVRGRARSACTSPRPNPRFAPVTT